MILKAQNIRKSYGKLEILKGVSPEVAEGEILCITGASGSGKSTLLYILGTLDRPDIGKVHIDEQDVYALSKKKLAEFRNRYMGFVFQFHNLLPEFTALENVMIPAFIAGEERKSAERKASDLLNTLGLADRVRHKPSELSGGEQQRVAVARALINKPRIVFADEPGGNLDASNAAELHRLFFTLRDSLGCTFVIVTHNTELATMADRRLHLSDGKIT